MRIVSLLPSATEILCALGLEQHLVAISHECDYPPSVASLPRITQSILQQGMSPKEIDDAVRAANLDEQPLYSIDADKLIALEPDLIVTQGVCAVCAVAEETVHQSLSFARVETVSAATVLSLESLSLDGIEADIRKLGALSDRQVAADRICSKMKGVRNSLSDLPGEPPRVLMLEWPDPPWYGGHWVPEQVAAAGGLDVFGRAAQPSGRLTWEQVREANPEVIVACACGFNAHENHAHLIKLLDDGVLKNIAAVKENQLWAVDANSYFSRPGPRTCDGIELLRSILSAEIGEFDSTDVRRVVVE